MKMLMSITDLMCVCVCVVGLIYSTELQPLCVCGCGSVRHSEQQHVMQVLIHQGLYGNQPEPRHQHVCVCMNAVNASPAAVRTCVCVCMCVTFLRSQLHAGRSVFTSSVICIRFPVICSVPLHKH
ncbi:hypothetical protein INR49_018000 [Caranx melampygus]|nr:hypothetical protein INR49_018000 [Caranx melampygus]